MIQSGGAEIYRVLVEKNTARRGLNARPERPRGSRERRQVVPCQPIVMRDWWQSDGDASRPQARTVPLRDANAQQQLDPGPSALQLHRLESVTFSRKFSYSRVFYSK